MWYRHNIHDKCKLSHYNGSVNQSFTLIWTSLSSTVSIRFGGLRSLTFVVQLLPFPSFVNHLTSVVFHSVCLYPVHISLVSWIPCTCLVHQFLYCSPTPFTRTSAPTISMPRQYLISTIQFWNCDTTISEHFFFSYIMTLFWTPELYVQTYFSNKWADLYESSDKIWGKHVINTTQ